TKSNNPLVEWQMITSWFPVLTTLQEMAEYIAQRVQDLTDGQFLIEVLSQALPKEQTVLDAVQSGTAQCGHTIAHYYSDRNPAFAFGCGMPFGLTPSQQQAWLYEGGGLEIMQTVYADFGTIAFPAASTGMQMGGWFKREVNTLADLEGLRMRIPGFGGKIFERLGVRPVSLPPTELAAALEQDVLDAAEWIGPYDDEQLKLYQVAPYYYYPGWWEPGSSCDLVINQAAWEQLPLHYQQVLQTVAAEADSLCLAWYSRKNAQALTRLLDQGTQLRPFSAEILARCQTETLDFLADIAAENVTFRTVYATWQQFRQELYRWASITDLAFGNASFLTSS
ncbi:MAG: TRAP transporter substrate-binding protein, partial [Prochlorotrichaceae cyanobacterium]